MSQSIWGDEQTQFFFELTPEAILSAIDSIGFETTGRVLTLNSMENRVYEVEVSKDRDTEYSIIAKFYRPGRWSEKQILDEHQFLLDLDESEVPVIPPIKIDQKTLFQDQASKLYFALFPKKGGRAPDEMSFEQLEILGRQLARLHNIGAQNKAQYRLNLDVQTFGRSNLNYLMSNKLIPKHIESSYQKIAESLFQEIEPLFKSISYQRIHGDCHLGNIIYREHEGMFFIDFDDMLMGPAVQDIWLIVPGRDQEALIQRDIFLEAYQTMRDFNFFELRLIEPLRALRYIHFTSWMAKRWEDPSFKQAFPFFGDESYWQKQIQDLTEQLNLIKGAI